ncbi:MAG: quinone-dependent dihydroorotate dehydrogenase [Pseudobdellovibrionaceae bacterium]
MYLPTHFAHDLSELTLPLLSRLLGFRSIKSPQLERKIKGLVFQNPFGLAGGVDKNAKNVLSWQRLGCGFVEIGTITPEAQSPNPGQILLRDIPNSSLWNKMGFPNDGSDVIFDRLQQVRSEIQVPLFINIGKGRETAIDAATEDYLKGVRKFFHLADAMVVNISSPNTQNLRHLQSKEFLEPLLRSVHQEMITLFSKTKETSRKPLFLIKLSPDLSADQMTDFISTAKKYVDGFILTNTTTFREASSKLPVEGGVSGKLLQTQAENALRQLITNLGSDRKNFLIVSVGGVMNPKDALKRLEMGADLIQVYAGLIYYGPTLFQDCCRQMEVI